jgi:lipoprotein-anchoring transpeptidase ErfK/SrfK
MRTSLLATALVAAFACAPVLAQSSDATFLRDAGPSPVASAPAFDATAPAAMRDPRLAEAAAEAAALAPGESRWLDGARTQGAVLVVVDLSAQRAIVYRDGHPVAVTTVSTGMAGRDTPPGVYPILVKEKMHHSNLYDNAPMPFMQRLTWTGMALHAGRIPGYPASHGCVRLPKAFAEQLYGVTSRGDMVVVAEDNSAQAMVRAGMQPALAMQVGDLSPTGGASMLASSASGGGAGDATVGLAAQ